MHDWKLSTAILILTLTGTIYLIPQYITMTKSSKAGKAVTHNSGNVSAEQVRNQRSNSHRSSGAVGRRPPTRVGSKRESVTGRASVIKQVEDSDCGSHVASKLCSVTLGFFNLLLRQRDWYLRRTPLSVTSVGPSSLLSRTGDSDEGDLRPELVGDNEIGDEDETELALPSQQGEYGFEGVAHKATEPGGQTGQDMLRFMLSEERDKLCLWKFNYSDQDLDSIIRDESSLVGSSVLESLVSIAEALLGAASK